MNVPEKHRAKAHAWVDGADVEHQLNGLWIFIRYPAWLDDVEYRIQLKVKIGKRYKTRRNTEEGIMFEFSANGAKLFASTSKNIYDETGKCVWSPADERRSEDDDLTAEVGGG